MYYGYTRVSTETQAEHGQGLDVQKSAIEKYASDNGITLDGFYTDAGISGTVADRPALTEMLAGLEKDDKIMVLNTSRLWRNETVKVLTRREIEKVGADIISIEQPTYTVYSKDPNDFFVNSIMEILDQYDRMNISRKLAAGRRQKAKSGSKSCGSCPYGYKWDNAQIVIDYNNNLVVEDIFKQYAACRSFTAVADYCKSHGYKTAAGNDFSKQTISAMVKNDFYIGVVTYQGVKHPGTHPVFISRELFTACNPGYQQISVA